MPKRCEKGKGTICGNACFIYVILLLSRVLGSIWCAKKKRQIEWDAELDAKSVLASFRNDLGITWGAKILKTATWIDCMVCMRWRVRKARFSRLSSALGAKASYRFLE